MNGRIRRLPNYTGACIYVMRMIVKEGAILVQEMQNAETAVAAAPMSADEQRHLAQSIRQEMGIHPDEDVAMQVNTAPLPYISSTSCQCIQCAASIAKEDPYLVLASARAYLCLILQLQPRPNAGGLDHNAPGFWR